MSYQRHRSFLYGFIFTSTALAMKMSFYRNIYFLWTGDIGRIDFLNTLSNLYINVYRTFFAAQFILACLTVKKRFECLNNQLKTSLKSRALDLKTIAANRLIHLELRRVIFQLCDIIEVINETFTFHIIFIFTIFLVSLF